MVLYFYPKGCDPSSGSQDYIIYMVGGVSLLDMVPSSPGAPVRHSLLGLPMHDRGGTSMRMRT